MKKNPYYFIGSNPTCDLIIVNPDYKILLILRSSTSEACPNEWAFPGGFIETVATKNTEWKTGMETPEIAALRELKEETNLTLPSNTVVFPVGIYQGNNRDPRDNDISWSKSHAFITFLNSEVYQAQKDNIRGLDDAKDAKWFSIEEVLNMKLAFDHSVIFNDAMNLYLNNPSFIFNNLVTEKTNVIKLNH